MPVGSRYLTVLGEFKPFGLIAEAVDGKSADNASEKYDYFLFDSKVVRQREDGEFVALDNALSDHSDHELFIRGNRITWSAGSRVFKRFTLSSTVIMACWCRLNEKSEALLCVLQVGSLTIYHISGEIVSIPLPRTITSIRPLPFGLLLQQTTERTQHIPFSSSHPLLGSKDIPRKKREYGQSPDHHFATLNTSNIREDAASVSSHLILRDPPEEPQPLLIEERGKLNLMKEFDEKTIWTSDCIPFMASYHEGKMQHSLWVAEVVNPDLEVENVPGIAPVVVLPKNFSFRRIWQGKGAQRAASEVFLATDDDTAPLICFLLREQKKLLTVGLQSLEINNEIIFDIKPDMSWSVPAIAAAPVIVTRPRAKSGLLPFTDIIVLDTDNALLLYSGKQCLCRYLFPSSLGKDHFSCSFKSSEMNASNSSDLKIVKLLDAVEGRVNLVSKNGQIFRCALRRSPSSSLANDCIIAMSEGLRSSFYNSFLALLWGDGDSAEFCKADAGVDSEWESFSRVMLLLSEKSKPPKVSHSASKLAWDFLTESEFHKNYTTFNHFSRVRSSGNLLGLDSRDSVDTSGCPQEAFHFDLLRESLESLHAVYESLKLDNLRKRDLRLLVLLLCDIANVLGEEGYLDHYIRDFPGISKRFGVAQLSTSCATPPSLFRWLETCLQYGCDSANSSDLPPLICEFGSSVVNWARKIVVFYSLFSGAKQIGKKLSCGVFCDVAGGFYSNNQEQMVLAMVGERFGLQQLDVLPAGVSLPLRHALDKCRESPPMGWPSAAYVLLGREELASSHMASSSIYKGVRIQTNLNLISISTPYTLHLHPVTVPSTTPDSIGLENTKFDDTDSVDGTMADGMEHIFSSTTQLRYGRDLRLNEVRRLLCSARPVAIQTSVNPSALDQDLQQTQLWQLAQRTTALPMGRGAFTLATMHTLLTEALTVPKLVLSGRLPTQQNATINLDPNIRNVQELRSWPEFHNAVAAGLRLAPIQGKMSRTWIIYNRSEEPNGVHAGLLLALGLHGHLRVLKMIDIYQYLSQEHESTTVGVMLGLGASYRGTMEQAISKSLYVHVPSRYTSFPELEVPTILQSAALMSIGLLFEGSAHPPTMQTLLAELGRRSGGDNVLEREGHAVSAGFSLGLVALGRGSDALGGMDTLVSRLFQYIGGNELPNERSLFLTPPMEDQNRGAGQMMDGTSINVDVTAPGAIMALSLIFLKAESEELVSRLSIPNTHFELQYVRPDFIMLRVIARNLIMWSRIQPSMDWIQAQIPEVVKNGVEALNDELDDIGDMDAKVFVQAYVNIVTGACISLVWQSEISLLSTTPLSEIMQMTTPYIVTVGSFRVMAIFLLGLRYAGTRDENAQELLYQCAVYFLNEIKPVTGTCGIDFPKGLLQHVDRGTLEICLYPIILSLSVVMSGSGHLRTFRLLRFLRARNPSDGHANFGYQMAVSLATGFLFLGEGMRTFSTSNSSIATLLISLYPRLPTGPNDNRCHLQAFRHLYVLATESRCIQTLDIDTGLPVYAPLEITIRETEHYTETSFSEVSPCILPERSVLKRVTVCGPRYWPQVIELVPEERPWWILGDKNDPFNSGVLYIKRKVGACSYVDDPVGCQSLLSRAMHKVGKLGSLHSDSTGNQGRDVLNPIAVDQLISTFSSDPSLITFSQLCCDPSWNTRSDVDFQEFCLQVLFECVSKDRPALLQVYLSLYTRIGSMADEIACGTITSTDSLDIFSIKIAIAYIEALLSGRLSGSRGGIIKSDFIGSIRKRVEDLLNQPHCFREDLANYLNLGRWPSEDPSRDDISSMILAWYLQWFSVPPASAVKNVAEKIRSRLSKSSSIPFLRLLLPRTHIRAINEIDELLVS